MSEPETHDLAFEDEQVKVPLWVNRRVARFLADMPIDYAGVRHTLGRTAREALDEARTLDNDRCEMQRRAVTPGVMAAGPPRRCVLKTGHDEQGLDHVYAAQLALPYVPAIRPGPLSTASTEAINALPEEARDYIHALVANQHSDAIQMAEALRQKVAHYETFIGEKLRPFITEHMAAVNFNTRRRLLEDLVTDIQQNQPFGLELLLTRQDEGTEQVTGVKVSELTSQPNTRVPRAEGMSGTVQYEGQPTVYVCEQHNWLLWPDGDPDCAGPGMLLIDTAPRGNRAANRAGTARQQREDDGDAGAC